MKLRGISVRTVAAIGLFTAIALIFSYVEALVPSVMIPGVKLGLANLAVVILLYYDKSATALAVSLLRILISALLFGSAMSWSYALAGGMLSFAGMLILKKTRKFSLIAVSFSGGVLHNTGQLLIASVIFGYPLYGTLYLPVLLASGAVTGTLIGIAATLILPRLPEANRILKR